jgi:predicted ribosome quality control (RQC) complex YloA/Tae2 family protein
MNNYYALIYLTDDLNHKLKNTHFKFSISPHKNVWEGYFESNTDKDKTFRLIFSSAPGEIALFTEQYRAPKKNNVLNFFQNISGSNVNYAGLADGDRLLTINFDTPEKLVFQLFGNKANAFLVKDDIITDSFKYTNEVGGEPAPKARKPVNKAEPFPDLSARQMLIHFDQKLPRHLLNPIIDHYNLEDAEADNIRKVVNKITEAMHKRPEFRVLSDGNLCLIPEDLLPAENLKTFDNINDAIKFSYYKASHQRRFSKRLQSVRPKLEKALKKAKRAKKQLEKADKAMARAEKYEESGHLLMAHAHEDRDQSKKRIEVEDYYRDDRSRVIELKPTLTIAENAEYYYDKAHKARRRIEESKRREKEIQLEIEKTEELFESLGKVNNLYEFEDWKKDHLSELQQLGITASENQRTSRPYITTEYEGYEIWIGRSAKSNDKLTTDAHKEDIWLHSRGVSGSHVVIRMNNNKDNPPSHVVQRAASYAAWHSKARGSELVPVVVTKRKYVVKPKGAPAGTVRVNREDVEMVEPLKPDTK